MLLNLLFNHSFLALNSFMDNENSVEMDLSINLEMDLLNQSMKNIHSLQREMNEHEVNLR